MRTAISEDHILGAITTIKVDLAERLRCQSQIAFCGCGFGFLFPRRIAGGLDCGVGIRYGVLCIFFMFWRRAITGKTGLMNLADHGKKKTELSGAYTAYDMG